MYRNDAGASITLVAEDHSERLRQRGCVPPKRGEVNTGIIDANGKIDTFACPTPVGDQTLSFGEQADVVNPDGTSSIAADVGAGTSTVGLGLEYRGRGGHRGSSCSDLPPAAPPVLPPLLPYESLRGVVRAFAKGREMIARFTCNLRNADTARG